MIPLTLAEIETATGGHLAGGADPTALATAPVAFDSRRVEPGGLFLALPGAQVDGHDYATIAIAAGAVAVVATRELDVPCVVVDDGLSALGDLARAVLERLPDLTVIGVTGSSGKTSTKDLLAAVLGRLGPTIAPPGSFNNELGHPYTVLLADASTRYLVLEKSARGIGHIAYLTSIARPRIGVVLNVGSAHLGEFGSLANIATAKAELVQALPAGADGGVAVLNADDPVVAGMAGSTRARVVTVGVSAAADIRAEHVVLDGLGRASFDLVAGDARAPVSLLVSGEHQVGNALAAAAVALECGMSPDAAARALSTAAAASRWRMEITERADGVVVVNDAYNANPESMRAALKTLVEMTTIRARGTDSRAGIPGRSWAVLGEMGELGAQSATEHDALGRLAVRLNVDRLVAVGNDARAIAQGALLEGSYNGESAWVPDYAAAVDLVEAQARPGDVVLVKASRAAGLERVAAALLARSPAAAFSGLTPGAPS